MSSIKNLVILVRKPNRNRLVELTVGCIFKSTNKLISRQDAISCKSYLMKILHHVNFWTTQGYIIKSQPEGFLFEVWDAHVFDDRRTEVFDLLKIINARTSL